MTGLQKAKGVWEMQMYGKWERVMVINGKYRKKKLTRPYTAFAHTKAKFKWPEQ